MNNKTISNAILSTAMGFAVLGLSSNAQAGDPPPCGCPKPKCGDGHVDYKLGEECDDKNADNTDGCLDTCKKATCGDGYVWTGKEDCDDENDDNTDDCVACMDATCGDGYVWEDHEDCEDGNDVNTDDCVACQDATCGDGYVWEGEEDCDEDSVGCKNCCIVPYCGDGNKDPGEQCDDGNESNTDSCTNICKDAKCGDGFLQGTEQCDDGNNTPGDKCDPFCKIEKECPPGPPPPPPPCKKGKDTDGDGVCNKDDKCPGSVPDNPSKGLNPNHHAQLILLNSPAFETVGDPKVKYTIYNTAGCTCAQIVDKLKLGKGHLKHGCSPSAMADWVDYLAGQPLVADDEMDLDDPESEEVELEEEVDLEEFDLEEVDPEEIDLDQLDIDGASQMGCTVDDGPGHLPAWAFLGLVALGVGLRRRF